MGSCGQITESFGDAPAVGTVVSFGQTISTGSDGRAVITLPDNSTLALSENTEIVCDQFLSNGDTSTWSLLQGLFVYVSGLIGNQDSDQLNIENGGVGVGIRGCVGSVAVLPGGKLLLHVIEGSGFVDLAGKPEFDFPAGEGVLSGGDSYQETLRLPPGAASLIPARDRPPALCGSKGDREGAGETGPAVQAQRDRATEGLRCSRRAHRCLVCRPGQKGPE